MSSSSTALKEAEGPKLKRDVIESSSSSDSDSETDRLLRKKARKDERKRSKKESKLKKDKKDKKDKKEKREKKERKRKKDSPDHYDRNGSNSRDAPLSEHDAIEMASFRNAVQGKQVLVANEREQASLLHASKEDIAASLGLPKGLIRTTVDDNSITQRYSRDLFGGDDDNPAKRQRLNRERIAKRALEIARNTLNAKAAAAASAKPLINDANGLSNIMDRFKSSTK